MSSCPACGTQNPDVAQACAACGAGLPKALQLEALALGSVLYHGAYRLGRVLGRGGFTITYMASDVALRRPVGVAELFPYFCTRVDGKVVAGPGSGEGWGECKLRFQGGAMLQARAAHPGIPRVFTYFEESNTAFVVMELFRGQTLEGVLEERESVLEADALNWIRQAGEALHALHQVNVLHRDCKPANLLLNSEGRVVLCDFSNAAEFATGAETEMFCCLTPGYAPMEQYCQRARFGPPVDIYALGASLYHLLTGCVPVAATDRLNGVSLIAPSSLNPRISKSTNDAIMWAMETRVPSRPQNIPEFLLAFEGVADCSAVAKQAAPPVGEESKK